MHRVGKLSRSWGNRVLRVAAVVVRPAYSSVTCWRAAEDFAREVLKWGHRMCPGT